MPGSTSTADAARMPERSAGRATGTDPQGSADPSQRYDLVVLGAGPAGLAGAVTASEHGLSVALLDSAQQPGGQFYRHPAPATRATRPEALHHDWATFTDLRDRLAASDVTRLFGHHVWTVTREAEDHWTVHALTGEDGADWAGADRTGGGGTGGSAARGGVTGVDEAGVDEAGAHEAGPDVARSGPGGAGTEGAGGHPVVLRARAVLLATGSYERHLPFPGWTLPGVVGAGGAQAMLKSGLVLPGRRVVVAGSGPLLLAVAASLTAAGAEVPELVEAAGYLGYVRHPGVLAAQPKKLAEAAVHGAALFRHGVRPRLRHAVTEAHGTDRVEAVTVSRIDRDWRPVPGTGRRIACDALAVGHGLVPQTDLATALGCATRRTADGTHALALGPLQETSLRGLWAAGETSGIGGAQQAIAEGVLAALAVTARLTGRHPAPASSLRALRRRLDRMRAFAGVMATVHAPRPGWTRWLTDATDVCRCEEVTAGRIREAVAEYGARDARTVKLLTRAGMGWCQGRMCGSAVTCLAAPPPGPPHDQAQHLVTPARSDCAPPHPLPTPAADPAPPDRRPLATPVPLGLLAALPETPPRTTHSPAPPPPESPQPDSPPPGI
ncbi:NAD(P)/FAD-dependent oxidoreductase [Streptomyces sp. NPDC002564]|uniref:FAD/NAD(P)-dependent oxidoreductase n=1 Tax=Streptomyces sp. NPDC002564 TaxID=3364649 RepID=UPI0036C23FB1